MTASLTLISHHLCPYVQRAAIALAEKGVPFERVYIDLANKPDWFLKISPLGKVPLLRIPQDRGGAVLFESTVICEYLEETQPGAKLHLADPLARARHRGWMEFGSSILSDLWVYETTQDADTLGAKGNALKAKFATVEAELGDGPYFAGADFSLVDAVFAPIFRYFDLFDLIAEHGIFDGLPRVGAWRKALAERPSVRAAVTADYAERLMAFLEKHDAALLKTARIAA
ncbi:MULTISPECIES: glutathione S-transferase family protein [Sinorhizobium]|uniref:glutathione S-transferase family protein n=1 Tax=Sinorhizobium TaxID=28105 RepID=UPI0004BC2324|nr:MULTISPECIES: glutathione S-transferase family protein [Sinorhizobium]ASY58984.1 Glutathione S-transferase [Sinorhizobium sp. CCBAU 05631]PDT53756.1 glutathione S-transferase family protein [Sinorhizobium sp. NG07B]POH30819.1 glutathione S-transferase [Sinorhizobium americanum]